MNRLFTALVALVALAGLESLAAHARSQPATAPAAARPNVIFVLIDDMGYADLSSYGQMAISTPNLDRLAAEGRRFTQFYVGAPICSPSRVAFLTGQFPARWEITSYLSDRRDNRRRGMAQWLDPAAPSLARILQSHGYATAHFGKWHMGGQRDVGEAPLITEYGFDESITNFEGLGDRYLPLLDAFDGTPPRKYDLGSANLGRGDITWITRSKMTAAWTEAAMKFIGSARDRGKPFYVNLWFDDVHSPFFPPKDLRGDESKRERYLGVVRAMDDQIERLFDLVRSDPALRDNTVIVVASDNGPEPGAGSAGPFKGHKGNLYEGGIREPFIVWAPGLMGESAVGTVDEGSVIGGADLLPSVLGMAGIAVPADLRPDGEDRSAAMLGRDDAPRTKPLFWVRPPDRPGPDANPWPDLAMRDGSWKLTCGFDGSDAKLIDLAADPGETSDRAADDPERVERMKASVLDWYATLPRKSATE